MAISFAGCSTDSHPTGNVASTSTKTRSTEGTGTNTPTPAVLGTSDDPWLGYVVHLRGDSQGDVQEVFNPPVAGVLIGDSIRAVFVTGEST
jgi:hypothetical protein